jgi:hypothetical protein
VSDAKLEILLSAKNATGQAFASMKRDVDGLSRSFASWKSTLGSLAVGFGAGSALTAIGRDVLKAASDLEEATNKFDVVFAGQGRRAAQAVDVLTKAYAMSTREARQYLSSVQDLLVPMGVMPQKASEISAEVVKLAADLGSFNNLPTAQVIGDMQSALVGQYETMKKYGIVMSETIVSQQALNLGLAKNKEALTPAQKAYASFTLMVKDSQAAIGDMGRTGDGAANQWKKWQAGIEDLSASFGKQLLPAAIETLKFLNNSILPAVKSFDDSVNSLRDKAFGIDRRSPAEKLSAELAKNEKTLSVIETQNTFASPAYIQSLKQVVALQREKLAILNQAKPLSESRFIQAYATGGTVAGRIDTPSMGAGDFAAGAGAARTTEKGESVVKRFYDEYNKALLDQFEYEKSQLAAKLKEYAEHVKDKHSLDMWYAAELRKIDIEEYAANARFDGDYMAPESRYSKAFAANQQAMQAYSESAQKQRDAMQQADAAANDERWLKTYIEDMEQATRANEIFKDSMDIMGQSAADAFAEFATGTKTAAQAFTSMSQSIIAATVRMISQRGVEQFVGLAMNAIGGYFSGAGSTATGMDTNFTAPFFATVKHGGGMAGESGPTRALPAWMIESAARYHSGRSPIGPGERAAVIRDDEGVFTPGQMKAMGKVTVNINNYTGSEVKQTERTDPGGGRQIEIMIGNALAGDGPAARVIENKYGLRRQGRR